MKPKRQAKKADAELAARNREAEHAALKEYEQAVMPLMLTDPREQDRPSPLQDLCFEIENRVNSIRKGRPFNEYLDVLTDLRLALVTPINYSWTEQMEGSEIDPISGNPKPVLRTRRKLSPLASELADLRENFKAYLAALAAFARKLGSPTYPELRDLYLSVRKLLLGGGAAPAFPEDLADDILARLARLLHELAADLEIDAFQIGGRK